MNRRTLLVLIVGIVLIGGVVIVDRVIRSQNVAPPAIPVPSPSQVVPSVTPVPTQTVVPSAPASPATPTSVPATPQPPTPTPGPIVTIDKLGVGVYSTNVDLNTLRVFRPAMILVADPEPATAPEIRKVFPKALIVGRHVVPDGDPLLAHCDDPNENHMAKGVAFADYIGPTAVKLKGVVDAWVSDNEQTAHSAEAQLPCHSQFQTGFEEQLQGKYGVDAVSGNDGSGALDPADYPKYFAKPISEAAYFGVHAYGKPESKSLQDDSSYYALRYRMIHDQLAKAGINPKKGYLLTETGLYQGWRGMTPDDQMAKDFIWLEQETEKDPYVVGQFIFGLGLTGKFDPFEIRGTTLIQLLGQYNLQHAGTP